MAPLRRRAAAGSRATVLLLVAMPVAATVAGRAAAQSVPEPTAVGRAGGDRYFQGPVDPPYPAAQALPPGPAVQYRYRAAAQAPEATLPPPPPPEPAIPLPEIPQAPQLLPRSAAPVRPPVADRPGPPPPAGDASVVPAGCASCGTGPALGGPSAGGPGGLLTGCGCGPEGCYPGRTGCSPCHAETRFGAILCGLYECVCCPDPCYEPKWTPLADAAFFTPAARPVTQTRFRGTFIDGLGSPDRAEWFWPRADGRGRGPTPTGPDKAVNRVNADMMTLYAEAATGRIGVFTETRYWRVMPDEANPASGFGDLTVGTKTLLFDCELLQVAFQFATYIPTGNFSKGLGTGHVSLEPSMILGLKLAPETFLQGQFAEWVPLGGDPNYQGSVFHYHFSLNHVLIRPVQDVPIIGVFEVNGITFQTGAFTDPVLGSYQRASGTTYFTLGPGLRVAVCDRIDFGAGSAFAAGNHYAPQQEYRIEFRVRY